jgi:hypothetical protein
MIKCSECGNATHFLGWRGLNILVQCQGRGHVGIDKELGEYSKNFEGAL